MMNQSMEDDEWVSPEGEDAGVESELKQDKLELHHYVTAVSQVRKRRILSVASPFSVLPPFICFSCCILAKHAATERDHV